MPKTICHEHCPPGHGSGSGLGPAVLAVLAAAAVIAAIRAAWHAIEPVLIIAGITAAALAVLAVAGVTAGLVMRHRARTSQPALTWQSRPATLAVAAAQLERELPASPAAAIEAPASVHQHLHLHGVTAEDLAAILRQPGVYGPGNEHHAITGD